MIVSSLNLLLQCSLHLVGIKSMITCLEHLLGVQTKSVHLLNTLALAQLVNSVIRMERDVVMITLVQVTARQVTLLLINANIGTAMATLTAISQMIMLLKCLKLLEVPLVQLLDALIPILPRQLDTLLYHLFA